LTRQFHLDVKEQDRPSLSLVSSLTSENGGVPNGVLDPGEKANLHLVISNDGRAAASGLEINVTNLSGGRVSVGEVKLPVADLAPGATTTIDVPVVFSGNHTGDEVDVGVAVEARELEQPLVRQITLPVSVIAGRVGALASPGVQQ
jgi:hypothetical protein